MQANPKGIAFWVAMSGAATCIAFANGPAVGVYAFLALALMIRLIG